MGKRDARVDAYIAKAAQFAQPLLQHVRELMHEACPDVEETIKWGMPFFQYRGLLANMAAFKQHCAFGFWKGSLLIKDNASPLEKVAYGAFSDSGFVAAGKRRDFRRLTKMTDMPTRKQLTAYIRAAMKLNEDDVKVPARAKVRKAAPRTPADLAAALKKNARARAGYAAFSATHKREYVEWLTEAKTPATRERRLAAAIDLMAQGKSRHWKYA